MELELLLNGTSSMVAVPNFVVPARGELVVKYSKCTSFNIVYESVSDCKGTRDSLVACDLDFYAGRRAEATRVYGEIRYFLKLPLKNSNALEYACIAYVDWFTQTVGDGMHVSRTHPPPTKASCRAVPISAIVCKIALFPVSAGGRRCSVVELL